MKSKIIETVVFAAVLAAVFALAATEPMQAGGNPMAEHYKADR